MKRYTKHTPLHAGQWNKILSGLANCAAGPVGGEEHEGVLRAVLVLKWMHSNGATPDVGHYTTAANGCAKAGGWNTLHSIMAEAIDNGLGKLPGLTRLCVEELSAGEAKAAAVDVVLQRFAGHGAFTAAQWTIVLNGLAEAQDAAQAVLVLQWMHVHGMALDVRHYGAAANACEQAGDWARLGGLMAEVDEKAATSDTLAGPLPGLTRFCYGELSHTDTNASAVDGVLQRYTKHRPFQPAQWAALLTSFANVHDDERGELVLQWMEANGADPDAIQNAILSHFPFYQMSME
jgi:hypothetical protein